jgi:hypothetical protein
MGATGILLDCRSRGVTVAVRGGRLHVAPVHRLTPALRAALTEQAPALVRLLSRPDRVSDLQEICRSCDALFVDVRGLGQCSNCHYEQKAALARAEEDDGA